MTSHDIGGRIRAARDYLSTAKPLIRLVWWASPPLFVASVTVMLLSGLVPTANIFITSALLETVAQRVGQSTNASSALPTNFVLLLALLAVVSLSGRVLDQLGKVVTQLQGTRVTDRVELLVVEKATQVDLADFEDSEFHNRMQMAANEASQRPKMIIDELMGAIMMLTTFVSLATVLLLWQAWVVPTIVIASLATLWVSTRFGTALVELVTKRAEIERTKFYLHELCTSEPAAKEVRLFGLQGFLLGKFRGLLETTYGQDRRLASRELAYSVPASLTLGAVQTALIAFTALQALRGTISIGQFSLYTQSIVQLGGQLPSLMSILGGLHESNLFVASIFGFLSAGPRVEAPRPGSQAQADRISRTPRVEFKNVCFGYPRTERLVLENVSFEILPGEAIALVGENGAGKTTLVKLLAGLYEPTQGEILLDGVDIRTLDRDDLRAYLSLIFQDYTVYHFSALENIGMGQVNRLNDVNLVEEAARRSGLDQIIQDLPNGYDTVLGRYWDSGHELSGGQEQLVALARALLRDAPILILDEPSAALDIYTERNFFRQLLEGRQIERPRTVIFVSHRFATVRRADRILVIEDGRLSEQGTHEELVTRGGHYAEMFKLQAAMYTSSRPTLEGADRAEARRSRLSEDS